MLYAHILLLHVCVCTLPFRLDTIVGPQTLSGKTKTFSSPSLHLYYSQAKKKHSASGSADPHIQTSESIAEAVCPQWSLILEIGLNI